MKALQINVVYGEGSTGKICQDLHFGFKERGIDSYVIYGCGNQQQDSKVIKIGNTIYSKFQAFVSRITGVMYGGCHFATRIIINRIVKLNPDVIFLHCLNGHFVNIFRLVEFLRSSAYKTILILHAEFMYTGSCGHSLECNKWITGCGNCPQLLYATKSWFFDRTGYSWRKMYEAFYSFDSLCVVSVSPWLYERAKSAPILQSASHNVIFNGVNTNIFTYCKKKKYVDVRSLEGRTIVFHVTASFTNVAEDIKGGVYVLELAKRFINEPVLFVVAKASGNNIELPQNILDLGKITDQHILAEWYSLASVTLLTSKKETFSMVCAESLCCGTPVVGFKSGAPERISISDYSQFVDYGDIDALEATLRESFTWLDFDKHTISKRARELYSKERMIQEYIATAENMNK